MAQPRSAILNIVTSCLLLFENTSTHFLGVHKPFQQAGEPKEDPFQGNSALSRSKRIEPDFGSGTGFLSRSVVLTFSVPLLVGEANTWRSIRCLA